MTSCVCVVRIKQILRGRNLITKNMYIVLFIKKNLYWINLMCILKIKGSNVLNAMYFQY
jgi:hypothetical protein